MKGVTNYLFLILATLTFIQCSEDISTMEENTNRFNQTFPIVYNAEIPDGKLPYPHHNPEYSQGQYDSLVQNLFIINNFGQYQGGDTEESCYFHDGLDFVMDNGTPIFALAHGYVRANIGGNEYYRTLVVEDIENPGYAWSYTHIYNFDVVPGSEVEKGQFLGTVNFQGLDHIHLNRTRLKEGGDWKNFSDLINIYPDEYFTFIDFEPPTISTPFLYFPNVSDVPLPNQDTIAGDIDIVVSIRDGGRYTGDFLGTAGFWGDRHAVRDISYRILRDGEEIVKKQSFDFRKLEFVWHAEKWKETLTVYKHLNLLDQPPENINTYYSHYIITNARDSLNGRIDPQDTYLSWNTLEKDEHGEVLYPNGTYQIEVTAHDSQGNKTIALDEVVLVN